MKEEQSIRKSSATTIIVMVCTLLSRILGFVRVAVITAFFGASGKADVINLTFAIPNNLRKLLAEGALSSAFIPVLSESIIDNGTKSSRTRNLVRSLLTFQLLILIPLIVISILAAKPLVTHVLTQFDDPEQVAQAVPLFKFFINYLLLISVSALMIGVLNSTGHFFIPAVTPLLFSISVILSIIFLTDAFGIYSMAIGVLIGGLLQIIFQFPLFKKTGFDFKLSFSFSDPYFKKIVKHWLPVLATSGVFTINQQIAFLLATGLEKGSTSALSNALVFWQLPFGIFSASITTVLFPRMSRQAAAGNQEGLKESINVGLRMLFSLLVPSAIVLGLFSRIIISVALQRGLFTADNTIMTSYVLTGYVFGLFSVGAFNFIQRYFYAIKDFRIPFYVSVFVCTLDITLSIILKNTSLRVAGLAAANSISFTAGFIVLYLLARKKLGSLFTRKFFSTMGKVVISVIPSTVLSFFVLKAAGESWRTGPDLASLVYVFLIFAVWIIPTLVMYKLLNVEVISFLLRRNKKNV
ncbi:MAG: murein biosynthesis integral membrane protein MurJ [Spirochaetes bacterium]|nr:MAG: murein biosynthesis integral membrane protein MurJ [Spirochaetota bacterium]